MPIDTDWWFWGFVGVMFVCLLSGIILFSNHETPKDSTVLYAEVDGCKTYRIQKGYDYPVYVTKCDGSNAVKTQTTEAHGKSSRSVEFDTINEAGISKLPVDDKAKPNMVLTNINNQWTWVTIEEAKKIKDGRSK